ncbi:ATP-binding cassette domain-containing protein [Streptomyces abyssomicinicus]|uniref:ATP-binding cassette domain-containing protein n=1 Tax=Streptomyces abyssomicinicus TaxID=574929 RepID=UPI00350E3C56
MTFEAGPGALVAVTGPSGSGRTALLLTLTGRMKPSEGSAGVAGLALPRRMAAVRRVTGVAHVPGVTDLDPALTVAEHLRERALVGRRYGGPAADVVRGLLRPPRARAAGDAARAEEALGDAGLDLAGLPKGGRTAVRDLSRAQELRLSVALALLGRPDRPAAVAVDDADLGLSAGEREEAAALLRSLAASGMTVLAAFREAPPEADVTVSTASRGEADADGAAGPLRPEPLARLTRRGTPRPRGAAVAGAAQADAAAARTDAAAARASGTAVTNDGSTAPAAGAARVAAQADGIAARASGGGGSVARADEAGDPAGSGSGSGSGSGRGEGVAGGGTAAGRPRAAVAGRGAGGGAGEEPGPVDGARAEAGADGADGAVGVEEEAVEARTAEEDADAHAATGRA